MTLYRSFAGVLTYPDGELEARAEECAANALRELPSVAELVGNFLSAQRELGTSRLQEIYASAFDMQPECTLNLSYHLFGEDQRRGLFLAKLKELYEQAGVDPGSELPDHLCLMLRYLGTEAGMAAKNDLIVDCLLPAVSKIRRGVDEAANPYRYLLDALLLWLKKETGSGAIASAAAAGEYRVAAQPG